MFLQNPLALVLVASTLVGGGAVVGSRMMGSGDDNPCGAMQGMDHMGGGMMGSHADMMTRHDDTMAGMDEMHARCHEMMESHHGGNATAGHGP